MITERRQKRANAGGRISWTILEADAADCKSYSFSWQILLQSGLPLVEGLRQCLATAGLFGFKVEGLGARCARSAW